MSSSDALKRAIRKYDQEKIDRIPMRVPKHGKSINAILNRAVDETMARDQNKRNPE